MTPIPGKDGGTASFAGGDVISVIAGTKNKAGAQDFVKWATDEEAQTFLAKNGSVPVRTDLVPKIYATQGARYKVFGQLMGIGKTPYSTVENAVFNDNNGPWVKMINDAVFGPDVARRRPAGQKSAQALIDGQAEHPVAGRPCRPATEPADATPWSDNDVDRERARRHRVPPPAPGPRRRRGMRAGRRRALIGLAMAAPADRPDRRRSSWSRW